MSLGFISGTNFQKFLDTGNVAKLMDVPEKEVEGAGERSLGPQWVRVFQTEWAVLATP